MAISDFDSSILQDFLTEGTELLDQLDADLVELEDVPEDTDLLNRIFRALHTIKGSASFLAITNLVNFAHAAEDALNVIRKGEVKVTQPIMDGLLRSVDIVRSQFSEIESGQDPQPGPQDLIDSLKAIAAGKSSPGASAAAEKPNTDATVERPASSSTPEQSIPKEASESGDNSGLQVTVLQLPGSKMDLLEFMVADVHDSLAQIREAVAGLEQAEMRANSAAALGELAEALGRTVEFFELPAMTALVNVLDLVGDHAATADNEAMTQVVPRLRAIIHLIEEQANGLSEKKVLSRPTEQLQSRVIDLMLGNGCPPEGAVTLGCSIDDVLRTDLVINAASPGSESPVGSNSSVAEQDSNVTADVQPAAATDGGSAGDQAATQPQALPAKSSDKQQANKGDDAEGAEARGAQRASSVAGATIRVEVGRLESLLNLVGELVIQKNRIGALMRQVMDHHSEDSDMRDRLSQAASDLDRVTGDIQIGVMRTRMQPLEKLFGKYPRLVRDLARATGKNINLEIMGGETEVDKSVLEELGDPLVHILRNSADHGIESPEERKQHNKPETGTIRITAGHQGSDVLIRIEDNGGGIRRQRVLDKAIKKGLIKQEEVANLSDKDVVGLIMLPGFSTVEKASDLSGRGVGMDVVKTNIQKLNGSIDVESVEGEGTSIIVKIPLTVAILSAMMVGVGEDQFAVPLTNIIEIVKPDNETLSTIRGHSVMQLRDRVLPLVNLARRFNIDIPESASPFAVVVGSGQHRVGLMVSRLIGQQEIVIKPLDNVGDRDRSISGASVREDGGVSLILDVDQMIQESHPSRRLAS